MDAFPLAMIIATGAARNTSHSALPDAPVVPDRPRRPHGVRSRTALAHGLEYLARAIAPPPRPVHPAGPSSD